MYVDIGVYYKIKIAILDMIMLIKILIKENWIIINKNLIIYIQKIIEVYYYINF